MSSSPRISGTTIILVGVLAWIIVLSYGLRRLFGAEVTGGWMLIGILFSLGALGFLVILNEIRQAVTIPAGFNVDKWRRGKVAPEIEWIDWSYLESRRLALGLSSDLHATNCYRAARRDAPTETVKDRHLPTGGLVVRTG
jgi:hypothetical protein